MYYVLCTSTSKGWYVCIYEECICDCSQRHYHSSRVTVGILLYTEAVVAHSPLQCTRYGSVRYTIYEVLYVVYEYSCIRTYEGRY